jgi:hypothetical protein
MRMAICVAALMMMSTPASAAQMPEAEFVARMPHVVVIIAFFAFLLILVTIEILLWNQQRK